jgi:hypothetical protein
MKMGSSGDSPAVFQYFDAALAEITPDVLGLWATVPTSSPQSLAFGTPLETTAESPLWRINLPTDPHLAKQHLACAEIKLRTSQQALGLATDRLSAFIEAQQAGVAFGMASANRMAAQPEENLEILLRAISLRAISEVRAALSFGLDERLGGRWEQAVQ